MNNKKLDVIYKKQILRKKFNFYDFVMNIGYLKLTQEKFAIVDFEDYEIVNQYNWHAVKCNTKWYAVAWINKMNMKLHRFILKLPKAKNNLELIVDHKNGNGLDNRKCNLRICNHQQNIMHMEKQKNKSSQFKGVSWHKIRKKFVARIRINGKLKYLGQFENENQAAFVYNNMAEKYFGEFAVLNNIIIK